MHNIPIVDVQKQFFSIQAEMETAVLECLKDGHYIGGKNVANFEKQLAQYLGINYCVSCANGTDALQLALMALPLPKGSKIMVPAFTYISTAEVAKLLGYELVYCDVDIATFNVTVEHIQSAWQKDIKAIIVVHLFGQVCDITSIENFCTEKNIFLVEDNAQALGSEKNIQRNSIITTSFYPTKNLGAYGDGGALFCNNETLALTIKKMANHGQTKKYYHEIVGINSRLDTLQAAILQVKLKYLDAANLKRKNIAAQYQQALCKIEQIELPIAKNEHIYHQYTLKIKNNLRDKLRHFLAEQQIQTAVHYPLPIYHQQAFYQENISLPNSEQLCNSVLSIPIFPELTHEQIAYICTSINTFFEQNG
ncbi:MAG: DegT/DnrJ/EryC1/StrS family aminotransferase [Chitinophagales bacterium]|nr:DegT/DnrJ/EryC1/StrS family aminotransferase [Chitinophagales bacterium]